MLMVISPEYETFDILIATSFIDQVWAPAEPQNKANNIKAVKTLRELSHVQSLKETGCRVALLVAHASLETKPRILIQ